MTLDLDPDRRLALAYVPSAKRAAVEALWRLDVTLGAVLATGRDPMVSRIRLAWWRESLEKLDCGPPPAEPVLGAVARHVVAHGVTGAELAAMEEGWAALLDPGPLTTDRLAAYAAGRGGALFRATARLLTGGEGNVAGTGQAWALVDLARRSTGSGEARAALAAARSAAVPHSWPAPLRPLGMLALLAERDSGRTGGGWERQGSPARMLLMLRHRLTGH